MEAGAPEDLQVYIRKCLHSLVQFNTEGPLKSLKTVHFRVNLHRLGMGVGSCSNRFIPQSFLSVSFGWGLKNLHPNQLLSDAAGLGYALGRTLWKASQRTLDWELLHRLQRWLQSKTSPTSFPWAQALLRKGARVDQPGGGRHHFFPVQPAEVQWRHYRILGCGCITSGPS